MRAGRLDRRISIQRKTADVSPSGEPTEAWGTIAQRSASMSPVRGDERFTSPQLVASEQTEFRVRWDLEIAGLSPQDRIIYPALVPSSEPVERAIYEILAVHEIGRREGLQIITTRRPDVLP